MQYQHLANWTGIWNAIPGFHSCRSTLHPATCLQDHTPPNASQGGLQVCTRSSLHARPTTNQQLSVSGREFFPLSKSWAGKKHTQKSKFKKNLKVVFQLWLSHKSPITGAQITAISKRTQQVIIPTHNLWKWYQGLEIFMEHLHERKAHGIF